MIGLFMELVIAVIVILIVMMTFIVEAVRERNARKIAPATHKRKKR